MKRLRIESDAIGTVEIDGGSLHGLNAVRAAENFPISGRPLSSEPQLVRGLAVVKLAALTANAKLGLLEGDRAAALETACREVLAGEHSQYFTTDLMEGSGGTSLNMNVNEVIANRALVLLGCEPGRYDVIHPNDHVNRSQSTNDVVPTGIKIAARYLLIDLLGELDLLHHALRRKAEQFHGVLKIGRTCLQDAQPMTMGQAFGGYAALVERLARKLRDVEEDMRAIPLGATAIGTRLGAPDGYQAAAVAALGAETGMLWQPADDLFDALQNVDDLARASAELRTCALSLGKVASDLILLSSGPDGGLGELTLPAVQTGSSIMPGKVNPVQPMSLCQVGFAVAGNDTAIAMAARAGQLEINAYEPLIAACLLSSLRMLAAAVHQFTTKCVVGIEANADHCYRILRASSAISSAFLHKLGYDKVSEVVRESVRTRTPFLQLAEERGYIEAGEVDALLRGAATGGHRS